MTAAAAADEGKGRRGAGGRPVGRGKDAGSAAAKGKPAGRPAKGEARKRSNPVGRLRTGEAIYLVAAILLFVLMFFTWYGVTMAGESEVVSLIVHGGDAWQTLEVLPLFLMLTIAVAVGAALLRL